MTVSTVVFSASDMSGSKDTMIFEAFLRLFVETTGHYTEYICTQQDGRSVFEVGPSPQSTTGECSVSLVQMRPFFSTHVTAKQIS